MRLLSCLKTVLGQQPSVTGPGWIWTKQFVSRAKRSKWDLSEATRTMSSEAEGVQLSQVIQHLSSFAPLTLAESWDNVGLLVEPVTSVPIRNVLLTIDLTEAVMKEAVEAKVNLIIAYHPPIFQSLKRITSANWKERLVAICLEEKIAVFSPHTSWDAVDGGLSDWLVSPFKFQSVRPISPSAAQLTQKEFSHHMTVFCPTHFSKKCKSILDQNQALVISTTELESSVKFTSLVKKQFLLDLEIALNETGSHYSIYERSPDSPKGCGTGRLGKLKSPLTLTEAISKMKQLVGMKHIRIAVEKGKNLESAVESVAAVAGSGASVLRGVKADLYITGEMLHHDLLEANHSGSSVILLNHSDSERGFLAQFAPRLAQQFSNKLNIIVSKSDKDPIVTV